MRKLLFVLSIIFLGTTSSYASHLMGGEITYIHVGGNEYEITLAVYRDCSGIPLNAQQYGVTFESASCGQNFIVQLPYRSTLEVSQVCVGQSTTCNGGTVPGTEQYLFRDTVTLTPCSDWIMHWNDGTRNSAITNLVNPGGSNLYIQNTLDNVVGSNNNSPQFFNLPTPYLCVNQLAIYSHAASDVDGDSLYYQLNQPLTTPGPPGTPIAFAFGYSLLQPMITSSGMNLDSLTGEMCFVPSQNQISVISVIISEHRNGTLIGTYIREMQVVVDATCTNQNPTTGATATCGGSGGMSLPVKGPSVDSVDQNTVRMCPNDSVCMQITFTDPDPGDNVQVTTNLATAIPGATWTVANNNTPTPTGTFCWVPTPLDSGINVFSVILTDDACPISGQQTFTYDVTVFDEPYAGPDQIICGPQSAQLQASGGATYTWYDAATNIQVPVGPAFSCNPCSNPIAKPSSTTDYYVLSSLTAACENTDTVSVIVVQDFTINAVGDTTLCDFLTRQLNVNILSGPTPPGYSFLWNNGATLNNDTLQNPIASPTDSTWYVVEVVSPDGCKKVMDSVLVGVVPPAAVDLVPGNDTVCMGEVFNFDVSIVSVNDDFNGGFDPTVWSSVQGATTGPPCVPFNGDALLFNSANRALTTNSISTNNCTTVDFCLWIANSTSSGPAGCENADPTEDVVLNYSINGAGGPWVTIQTFNTNDWDPGGPYANAWQCFTINIPTAAQTSNTMFQWTQIGNYGTTIDNWALDDINISCGGNSSYNYSWSPATNLSNPTINDPVYTAANLGTTTYTVTLTDPSSGCSFSRSQDIHVMPDNLNPPILDPDTFCQGGFVTVDADTGFSSYYWIPSGGSNQVGYFNSAGSYAVVVTKGVCVDTSATFTITERPNPQPTILGNTTICDYDSTILSFDPVYSNPIWNFTDSTNTYVAQANAGSIILSVDSAGCTGLGTITITSLPSPSTSIAATTLTDSLCPGAFTILTAPGGPFDSYSWSPAGETDSVISTGAGVYSVTIVKDGCEFTTGKSIYTYPAPSADFTINPALSGDLNVDITFTSTATGNPTSWWWDFDVTNIGTGASTTTGEGPHTYVYDVQATYTVKLTVSNDAGCYSDMVKDYLIFSEITTPNIITPNGDGKNDYFIFGNLDPTLFNNKLTIMNRWGRKVFEQDNYNNDWDGGNLKEGTYFYVLTLSVNGSEEIYKGTLTLMK